jgi:hypothetical protein
MISGISNVTQPEPVNQSAAGTATQKPAKLEPQSGAGGDSVQLSKAAQATLATLQETTETNAQTVKEASHGDLQAKRLLAKEAADKSALK